jgi:hypothetical protein
MKISDAVESMVKNLDLFEHRKFEDRESWVYAGKQCVVANSNAAEEARRVLVMGSLNKEELEQLWKEWETQ